MYNHAGLWFTSATDMNVNEHERKSRKLMEIKETVLLFTYNYIYNFIPENILCETVITRFNKIKEFNLMYLPCMKMTNL
jgi:hypothetical protein